MKTHLVALVLVISTILIFANSYAQADDPVPSPVKQIKSGVLPQDVQCKEGFVLVIWPFDQSPACLSPGKAARLLAHGWVTPTSLPLKHLRGPVGYLGAYFTSPKTEFILSMFGSASDFSAPIIPQTASSGHLSFLFSNSNYPQSSLSVSYQSCTRGVYAAEGGAMTTNGTGVMHGQTGIHISQSCTAKVPLDFTYGKNSQGKYAVTTSSITLPCGNVKMLEDQLLPTKYDYVTFGVKTNPSVSAFTYDYLLYAHC